MEALSPIMGIKAKADFCQFEVETRPMNGCLVNILGSLRTKLNTVVSGYLVLMMIDNTAPSLFE